MSEAGPSSDCAEAIRRVADGDIADWFGLPEGCTHADLSQLLAGGEAEGNGRLSGFPARFRMYKAEKQTELVQAWFDTRGSVFLITFSNPQLSKTHREILRALGRPEAKLEPGVGFHADAHQWIYAARGLTLFVREHLDEIARVAMYRPAEPSYYENYLGGHDRRHYLPGRI